MTKKRFFAAASLPLFLAACSSEYSPSDIEVSETGAFVERGSSSPLDGTFVIEKVTGEKLNVEFSDGLPDGEVEMHNSSGDVILRTEFSPKKTESGRRSGGAGFINELLTQNASALKTDDYLDLFEDFSHYHGSFFQIDSNGKKSEGAYDLGEKIDRWKIFCDNGQLESDRTYQKLEQNAEQLIGKKGDELAYTCDGKLLLSAKRDDQGRLQGSYIENQGPGFMVFGDAQKDIRPKYERHYKDGELHGEQKEYDRNGLLKVHNRYEGGVKTGKEEVYGSNRRSNTTETLHWISEVRYYSAGQLNGEYNRYDSLKQVIESGTYNNDQRVGIWTEIDYQKFSKKYVDHDVNNFTVDKVSAFKKACFLPSSAWGGVNWRTGNNGDHRDCEYYVEKSVVDINKKIPLDLRGAFEKSSNWTYPAVAAAPKTYDYLKKHGLKTQVSDSSGRTRLHVCLEQYRKQSTRYPRCTPDQAITYLGDVDINAVSNVGTALHQVASARNYSSRQASIVSGELKVAKALIEKGADVNQVNLRGRSPLMTALMNAEYSVADLLLDASASVEGVDADGKTALTHFFITSRDRWRSKKMSSQATRVLAKMIALGLNPEAAVWDEKTVQDLSEENNTLHHLQMIKDAAAMASEFEGLSSQNNATLESSSTEPTLPSETAAPFADAQVSEHSMLQEESVSDSVEPTLASNDADNITLPSSENTQPSVDTDTPQISNAEALLKEQASFLAEQAKSHIAGFRLKTPKGNSALSSLNQLKKIDPQNPAVNEIEQMIGEAYLSLANGKIESSDKAAAHKHITSAKEFISDSSVIENYQSRADAVKPPKAVAKAASPSPQPSSNTSSNSYACDPNVKAIGIALLGRTFIARQSLPLSKDAILNKSETFIRRDYRNVRRSRAGLSYEQATSGKPIKFALELRRDGDKTQLSITGKTPPGVSISKKNYKIAFCELVSAL